MDNHGWYQIRGTHIFTYARYVFRAPSFHTQVTITDPIPSSSRMATPPHPPSLRRLLHPSRLRNLPTQHARGSRRALGPRPSHTGRAPESRVQEATVELVAFASRGNVFYAVLVDGGCFWSCLALFGLRDDGNLEVFSFFLQI